MLLGEGRARIIDALVQVVAERGYPGASVGLVVARARVSRRTFYEQFDGLEDCFAAVLDLGLTLPSALIVRAFAGEHDWREGARAALAALLVFFDSEPGLTRVWFEEAMAAGSWALEHRERNIAAVQALIVEHWLPPDSRERESVLVKGVLASILGALTTHVVTKRPEPLITLLGPLTSLVTSPFLKADAVREDIDRAEQLTRELLAERYPLPPYPQPLGLAARPDADPPAVEIPALLRNPKAIRARLCLRYLVEQGGRGCSPSNRQIATAIGVSTKGQMSKLLARLEAHELIVKETHGPAWPNAWQLTPHGQRVAACFDTAKMARNPKEELIASFAKPPDSNIRYAQIHTESLWINR